MDQFRQDPLTGEWVLIAPGRAKKPQNREHVAFTPHDCPFDDPQKTGQEKPIAIFSHGNKIDNQDEGWTIQILPNKYPAVVPGQCGPIISQGIFSVAAGVGAHELVITRDHDRHFANFTHEEMAEVVKVYRDRYRELAKDDCNKYISIFHNHGVLAGASIKHNHSQILTTPIVPPQIEKMLGRPAPVGMLESESARNVCGNDRFVAFCPFASRSPFEVNIFPKQTESDFGQLSDEDIPALAGVMREVFARLDKALGDPDYTFFIHTSPPSESHPDFNWHIEIMPRFSPAAGFEFGTGIFINTVDPDEAAAKLREATI